MATPLASYVPFGLPDLGAHLAPASGTPASEAHPQTNAPLSVGHCRIKGIA